MTDKTNHFMIRARGTHPTYPTDYTPFTKLISLCEKATDYLVTHSTSPMRFEDVGWDIKSMPDRCQKCEGALNLDALREPERNCPCHDLKTCALHNYLLADESCECTCRDARRHPE